MKLTKNQLHKIGVAAVAIVTIFLVSFVESKQKYTLCQGVNIQIDYSNGMSFLTNKNIERIIYTEYDSLVSRHINSIEFREIEKDIAVNPYVKSVKVYNTIQGILNIEIEQRLPIVRIINKLERHYYIDEDGYKLPISLDFSPHLPVFSGNIIEALGEDELIVETEQLATILEIAKFLDKNKFWNAQIEQIYIKNSGEVIVVPRLGNHKVVIKSLEDFLNPLADLKIFYEQVLGVVGWDTYHTINLTYDNQIISTKR